MPENSLHSRQLCVQLEILLLGIREKGIDGQATFFVNMKLDTGVRLLRASSNSGSMVFIFQISVFFICQTRGSYKVHFAISSSSRGL